MFGLYFIRVVIYMHINEIKELLQANEASALKKYGQNFLIDEHVLQTISASLKGTNTSVIEIGPGLGSLTRYLVKDYKEVLAYEIDPKMVNIIKGTIPNVTVVEVYYIQKAGTPDGWSYISYPMEGYVSSAYLEFYGTP